MRKTFELMQQLTDRLPPSEGRHHGIVLSDDGATLIIALYANGGFYKFNLDEVDFDKDADALVEELLELFRQAVREQQAKPVG